MDIGTRLSELVRRLRGKQSSVSESDDASRAAGGVNPSGVENRGAAVPPEQEPPKRSTGGAANPGAD